MVATAPAPAPHNLFRRLLIPSPLDVFFGVLLLAAFAHPQGLRSLLSDGDTGWHIRTGELVLATGHAPVADPFSFSRPRQPWFAWEWLADVVFAEVWRWRGVAGGRVTGRRDAGAGVHGTAGSHCCAAAADYGSDWRRRWPRSALRASTIWRGRTCFRSCFTRSALWIAGRRSRAPRAAAVAAGADDRAVGESARRLCRLAGHARTAAATVCGWRATGRRAPLRRSPGTCARWRAC